MNSKKVLGTSFIIIVLILSALSLITMASLSFPKSQSEYGNSYHYLIFQAGWLVAGGVGFVFTANYSYRNYKKYTKYYYAIGAFFLLLVLIVGKNTKGATRWISIGPISVQPSEFVKIILIITLSTIICMLKSKDAKKNKGKKVIDRTKKFPWVSSLIIMVPVFIYAILVILEKSFSSTAQIIIIGMTYLFISEIKYSVILVYTSLIGIGGWLSITKVGYRASRLAAYSSKDSIVYQTHHSLIAIANGKLSGRFYGNGLQKYNFLPEIHTDYIFSGFAEENGFMGVVFLMGLYLAMLVIMAVTLKKIKDAYAKYLLVGIFVMFATQIIGNIAVVSGAVPSTGIPLPMMSYGGSSIITAMTALGIAYNIIRALYKQEMGDSLDELNEVDYLM